MNNLITKFEKIQIFYHENYKGLSYYLNSDNFAKEYEEFLKNLYLLEDELKKIENPETPLYIAVVGNFSTGKSTFINSLLEDNLLGMKIEPATAKITHLLYDKELKIEKCYLDNTYQKIDKEEYQNLSIHIDGKENQNAELEKISHFRIFYNLPILNKINIYDTPGFSSISNEDDILTKEWIKKADLLLWLIDINEGGKADELENIKSFLDKQIVIIINRADNVFIKERERIQNNITENFQLENLLYAAKPILDFKINLRRNKKEFKDFSEVVENLYDNGEIFNVLFRQNSVEIINSKKDFRIDRIPLNIDKELQKYLEYNNQLYRKLEEIKENITEIKQLNLERKIDSFYNGEIEKIKVLKSKLLEKKQKIENENQILVSKLESQFSKINDKSKEDFENFRTNLFDQLYHEIFNPDFEVGGFWSSDKHTIRINKFNKSKIEKIKETINNAFSSFYQKIIDDANKLLNKTNINIDKNIYEIQIIIFIKDTYVDASVDSLISVHNIWIDREYNNFDEAEKDLKHQINLAIAEERIYQTTMKLLTIIYENEIEEISIKAQNDKHTIDELINNISNI